MSGAKLSVFHYGAKLPAVPNCPLLIMVPNCPQCQIVRGAKLSQDLKIFTEISKKRGTCEPCLPLRSRCVGSELPSTRALSCAHLHLPYWQTVPYHTISSCHTQLYHTRPYSNYIIPIYAISHHTIQRVRCVNSKINIWCLFAEWWGDMTWPKNLPNHIPTHVFTYIPPWGKS